MLAYAVRFEVDETRRLEFRELLGYVLTLTGEIWRIDRVSRQFAEHP
jgi:hypothetical protein